MKTNKIDYKTIKPYYFDTSPSYIFTNDNNTYVAINSHEDWLKTGDPCFYIFQFINVTYQEVPSQNFFNAGIFFIINEIEERGVYECYFSINGMLSIRIMSKDLNILKANEVDFTLEDLKNNEARIIQMKILNILKN